MTAGNCGLVNKTALATIGELHARYNARHFVHPDPLEFLYDYEDVGDREVVGLIASSLAYGRVAQILKAVSGVLSRMGEPARFLERASRKSILHAFADFKYRFTTGEELAGLLLGIKGARRRHGSLEMCFRRGLSETDTTVLPALSAFAKELLSCSGPGCNSLLPLPARGSACKRLNLFLRWMARSDEVDPGGWDCVSPAKLIIPLDTHMHRICLELGLTKRRQADMRTALEITAAFRSVAPDDPVRYDFALTRLGIRGEVDLRAFQKECGLLEVA